MSNRSILQGMIRLSRIVKDLREGRCKLSSVLSQAEYFIIEGESSNVLKEKTNSSVANCLYLEQYLRLSVSNMCACLVGFNPNEMDTVDYISSSDIKNKFVDICRGKKIIASINLSTGIISRIEPEHEETTKDNSPAVKS